MAMLVGNTAATPATSRTDTKAVRPMSEEMFTAEMRYQASISLAKKLLAQGLLTEEEYAVIDTFLLKEIGPSLGTLLLQNDLI